MSFIKEKMGEMFVAKEKLRKDLQELYICSFFTDELRNVFTEKERIVYIQKRNPYKSSDKCTGEGSQYCLEKMHEMNYSNSCQKMYVLKVRSVLEGVKFDHFKPRTERRASRITSKLMLSSTNNTAGDDSEWLGPEDLLMERQQHICEFKADPEDLQARLHYKRVRLMQQVAQHDPLAEYAENARKGSTSSLRMRKITAQLDIGEGEMNSDDSVQSISDLVKGKEKTKVPRETKLLRTDLPDFIKDEGQLRKTNFDYSSQALEALLDSNKYDCYNHKHRLPKEPALYAKEEETRVKPSIEEPQSKEMGRGTGAEKLFGIEMVDDEEERDDNPFSALEINITRDQLNKFNILQEISRKTNKQT